MESTYASFRHNLANSRDCFLSPTNNYDYKWMTMTNYLTEGMIDLVLDTEKDFCILDTRSRQKSLDTGYWTLGYGQNSWILDTGHLDTDKILGYWILDTWTHAKFLD